MKPKALTLNEMESHLQELLATMKAKRLDLQRNYEAQLTESLRQEKNLKNDLIKIRIQNLPWNIIKKLC